MKRRAFLALPLAALLPVPARVPSPQIMFAGDSITMPNTWAQFDRAHVGRDLSDDFREWREHSLVLAQTAC